MNDTDRIVVAPFRPPAVARRAPIARRDRQVATRTGGRFVRRLVAILYADVASYCRLTGTDEDGTHARLTEYLDAVCTAVERHRGEVAHYAGDAVLVLFAAVTDAAACALAIQRTLRERNAELPTPCRVEFRIGINLGDVIADRRDVYGNAVNVAARLQSLAEPGGICVSEAVRTATGNVLDAEYRCIGRHWVKNIDRPLIAYRLSEAARSQARECGFAALRRLVLDALRTMAAAAMRNGYARTTAAARADDGSRSWLPGDTLVEVEGWGGLERTIGKGIVFGGGFRVRGRCGQRHCGRRQGREEGREGGAQQVLEPCSE